MLKMILHWISPSSPLSSTMYCIYNSHICSFSFLSSHNNVLSIAHLFANAMATKWPVTKCGYVGDDDWHGQSAKMVSIRRRSSPQRAKKSATVFTFHLHYTSSHCLRSKK